ncbi:MAG: hypothetical protein ACFFD1_01400 [Candidatus Thorarchaeota archaeon]
MEVQAVYIFLKDGRCIFSRIYSENPADPQLLGGMLAALNIASHQWLNDTIRKFESEGGLSFVVKDFDTFVIAFHVTKELSPENEAKLDTIGYLFLSKFGHTVYPFRGNISQYRNFILDVDHILEVSTPNQFIKTEEINFRGKINEEKILDSLSIISLPIKLRKTAMGLLTLKECTPEQMAKVSNNPIELEEKNLEDLLEQGFIMCKTVGTKKLYYIP